MLPNYNYHHAQNLFDQEEITWLIGRLKSYSDLYTRKLITILKKYLKHKDHDQLANSVCDIGHLNKDPFFDKWQFADRMSFLEIVFPI